MLALGFVGEIAGGAFGEATHVSGPLDEVKTKLNDDIIFTAQDFRDLSCYPSE